MYITEQDYIDSNYGEDELIQLTDYNNIGVVDSVRFNTAVNSAESYVNVRLSELYTIPLSVINDDMKDILLAIIRAKLFVNQETEEVTKNYQDALKRFADYISGKAIIDGAERQSSSVNAVSKKGSDAVFTDDLFSLQ